MPTLNAIKSYSPPELHSGREWYISFYAFDPVSAKMKRKRIKLNSIKSISERRKYAKLLINRLSEQLAKGWNPWIESTDKHAYLLFEDALNRYRIYLDKMYKDEIYRKETYVGYISNIRNVEEWNKSRKPPITYLYQFDRDFCVEFLEEIFITRDNSAFTRDNYLRFLGIFSKWCMGNGYLKANPVETINGFAKQSKKKTRTTISPHDLVRLNEYVSQTDKYYLLACYILYYCFIRPKEMSYLRLHNFSLAKQTVFVPDSISKNKKDGVITLPKKVILLMIDLKIFDSPGNSYLFSDGFRPGREYRSEKQFRDRWAKIRKALSFPDKYKFYSLKDTGITNMLRHYDVLSVRDQARHSSILMTDIYTPHDIQKANELIMNYEDDF